MSVQATTSVTTTCDLCGATAPGRPADWVRFEASIGEVAKNSDVCATCAESFDKRLLPVLPEPQA